MAEPSLSDLVAPASRMMTFLSVDVVGSTAMKTGEPEQDIMATFLAYHKQASDLAYAHHGEVINIAGDGLMCRFQRADDALRMGESLLVELPRFNKQHNRLARPLKLRVGIHTGDVQRMEGLATNQWISRTIDLAAKIQECARADSVMLSEPSYLALTEGKDAIARAGWNAELQMNLFSYAPGVRGDAASRKMPDLVKILVVDDELDDVSRLRRALSLRRHDTWVMHSTAQAQEALGIWKPHAVLLSLDLPWDSGWTALGQWRSESKWSSIPILCLSHHTQGDFLQRAFKLGANAFIRKPVEDHQALKRLDVVLREFYL